MSTNMRFDAGAEATTISRLADQALNQSTKDGQAKASQPLQQELRSITVEQLRQTKAEMDRRIDGEKTRVKNYGYQVEYEDNPMRHHYMRMQLEKYRQNLSHQPHLTFVEQGSDICGVNVMEDKRMNYMCRF